MIRILLVFFTLVASGCMDLSPFSPNQKNQIDNQNGKIEDIKSNQNGIMLDFLKLRNEQELIARDIKNLQQGLINQNNENSGVQIFQGDGGLAIGFAIIVVLILCIYHYKTTASRNQKSAEILAEQVAIYNDQDLENSVFLSAMNSESEEHIYNLMVRAKSNTKSFRRQW